MGRSADPEWLACILAEDAIHGYRVAAARAGVTERTLRRYRKRLETEPDLVEAVRKKKAALLSEWEGEARLFMNKCMAKMGQLVSEATVENLRDVNGAAKIIGDLLVAKGVLGGGQSGADSQGPTPAAPPSGVRGKTGLH